MVLTKPLGLVRKELKTMENTIIKVAGRVVTDAELQKHLENAVLSILKLKTNYKPTKQMIDAIVEQYRKTLENHGELKLLRVNYTLENRPIVYKRLTNAKEYYIGNAKTHDKISKFAFFTLLERHIKNTATSLEHAKNIVNSLEKWGKIRINDNTKLFVK